MLPKNTRRCTCHVTREDPLLRHSFRSGGLGQSCMQLLYSCPGTEPLPPAAGARSSVGSQGAAHRQVPRASLWCMAAAPPRHCLTYPCAVTPRAMSHRPVCCSSQLWLNERNYWRVLLSLSLRRANSSAAFMLAGVPAHRVGDTRPERRGTARAIRLEGRNLGSETVPGAFALTARGECR